MTPAFSEPVLRRAASVRESALLPLCVPSQTALSFWAVEMAWRSLLPIPLGCLEALRRWGPLISCALFVDETTGGNVLKADQKLKVCVFYDWPATAVAGGAESHEPFNPVAACTHEQLKDGPRVCSLVLARLVRQWRAMGAWSATNLTAWRSLSSCARPWPTTWTFHCYINLCHEKKVLGASIFAQ